MTILRTDRPEKPRDAERCRSSRAPQRHGACALRRWKARGLTLIEVLVAAAILSVAALAALELLATSDAAALAARREAMASVEAERALADAAEALRNGREPSIRRVIDQESGGETLAGCALEVRAIRESRAVGALGANTAEIPIARLIAEVTSPDGTTLAILERVAPRETSSGGSR